MMATALVMLGSLVVAAPTVSGPIDALESVYTVTTPSGSQGAAFAIDEVTLVTAAHVVEGDDVVRLEGTQTPPLRLRATVRYRDEANDVAVLELAEPLPVGSTILTWSVRPVSNGLVVFAAGSPIDGVVLSRGEVLGQDEDGWIEASTPVDPGNSGGPLLDEVGDVVGVVAAQRQFGGAALAVPADIAQGAVLKAADAPPAALAVDEGMSDPPAPHGLSIAAVVIAAIALMISIVALVLAATRSPRDRRPPINITLD